MDRDRRPTISRRACARIRLVTCDVDGVLTDGRIYVDDHGHEFKAYSAQDGQGLKMLLHAGRRGRLDHRQQGARGHASRAAARHSSRRPGRRGQADAVGAAARGAAAAGRRLRARRRRPARRPAVQPLRARGRRAARAGRRARARALRHPPRRRPRRRARAVRLDPRRAGRALAAARGLRRMSCADCPLRGRADYARAEPQRNCPLAPQLRRAESALPASAGAQVTQQRKARSSVPRARRPMNQGRRLLDRLTAWSPVLLLGSLAALTFWLDAQVAQQPPRRDGSSRHDPDFYVESFRAVSFDARRAGEPVAVGEARAALSGRRQHRVHGAGHRADRTRQAALCGDRRQGRARGRPRDDHVLRQRARRARRVAGSGEGRRREPGRGPERTRDHHHRVPARHAPSRAVPTRPGP